MPNLTARTILRIEVGALLAMDGSALLPGLGDQELELVCTQADPDIGRWAFAVSSFGIALGTWIVHRNPKNAGKTLVWTT